MNEPIDLKTKKIISPKKGTNFDKFLVLENVENNMLAHLSDWSKFQQTWTNQAYQTFKDLDKYIVLMYLSSNYWQNLSDKFEFLSMDEYHNKESVEINKINLIQISSYLNIPKETIRRKINELQKDSILIREGKSIKFIRKATDLQKPLFTINLMSVFIEKKSNLLRDKKWFGEHITKEEIKIFIEKYYTIIWLRFFKLQIPYLIRNRNVFKDLETWIVWGNIALNHQYHFKKKNEKNIINQSINMDNYFNRVVYSKVDYGVNASSISDVSNIPRATVIRKLKWLVIQGVIKKTKKLEYVTNNQGKLAKKIKENFFNNHDAIAEFLTDFFDYVKNSNFKI